MAPASNIPPPEGNAGWTQPPSARGTLDIIWSCLSTVFICCWLVVHLDVPSPQTSHWHRLRDRLLCLGFAALAPELILAVAIKDFLDAKACIKQLRSNLKAGPIDWSMVHGFYICMGGFCIRLRKDRFSEATDGWLNPSQIEEHIKAGTIKVDDIITKQDIQDKGKADCIVKCVLLGRVLWFFVQCLMRATQHLSITTLEISALTYVPFVLQISSCSGGISLTTLTFRLSLTSKPRLVFLRSPLKISPAKSSIFKCQPITSSAF